MVSKDDVALARYGSTYDALSAWGKRDIDLAFDEPSYKAALPEVELENTLKQANLRLTAQLEDARQENLELWDENTELKSELETLRSQFNQPSS